MAVKEKLLCKYWNDEYCEYWDSEKACENCTVYKRITLYTKYAIVDNYHDRRNIPIAVFLSKDRAEEYLEELINKARKNKENYDFDIEEIITDSI